MLKKYQYLLDAVKSGFLNRGNYIKAFVEETEERILTSDVKLLPTGYKGRLTQYVAPDKL